ncbi:aminotransferase [Bacillus carboniphilus]|uniref:Aminotransferase n=1 Tax=Bacillus carboniphilus TaxID=86663 RepID=A0ABY9JPD6_9BACI|nr:aminotransferase [Bacillus carboniphilus]WLR41246.1 aminotransferase [Bacillus carboniphilus]
MKTKLDYLSHRAKEIKPSGIRKFFDLAANMEGVISLGVGEPDFITSWSVREACINSLEQGFTSYTANAGLFELREQISLYLERRFNASYRPDSEILVTVGASQAIDLALRAIINSGDEVIVIVPCFVSYGPLVSLAGGTPIFVTAKKKNGFGIHAEEIRPYITSRTKAILICSPNNPTGTTLSTYQLNSLACLAEEEDLIVISDEIYAELSYDDQYTSFSSLPKMKERTILVSGLSKGYAMTGWRLGYVAAPDFISEAILKIHQYSMMCAPTMAQFGAIEAIKNGEEDVMYMKKNYKRRRNVFVKRLNEIGLDCHLPGGAFYAFPSITKTGYSSEEFAEKLLIEEKVAVVPGNVFGEGGEGYVRCSYACSLDELLEAIKRIERFLNS